MFDNWLKDKDAGKITVKEAQTFVEAVRTSQTPAIKSYLGNMSHGMARAAAKGVAITGKNLVKMPGFWDGLRQIGVKGVIRDIIDFSPLDVFDMIPGCMYDPELQRQMIWESKHPGMKYIQTNGGC